MAREVMAIDKSTWGDGPWQSEPDSLEFEHAGFRCWIKRHPGVGHLCGYVDLPAGHHAFGRGYDDIEADVHGGLTYAKQVGDAWRVGFDCAHIFDYCPAMSARERRMGLLGVFNQGGGDVYRALPWVRKETERLAEQLSKTAVTKGPPDPAPFRAENTGPE